MEPAFVTLGPDVARLDVKAKDFVTLTLFSAEYNGANGERVPASSFSVGGIKELTALSRAIDQAISAAAEIPESEIPF